MTTHNLLESMHTAGDFFLPDHRSGVFRLHRAIADYTATVLVFYRGHWCPYCRRYLSKLQANIERFRESKVLLVAISPEPPATSKSLADQLGLEFPLLSDGEGIVIDMYHARNRFTATRALMPHPALFVIDNAANIRFHSIDRNFKKRTTLRAIFAAIDQIQPPK